MIKPRKIELLAPAKNFECGIEAVKHGADAVYIGAPQFSARSAAGNTVDDIKSLAEYAHLFGAKIYVALNTILGDKELEDAGKLIWQLYNDARIDALIIQDMGITMLDLPPIPLHASTQVDNRSIDKIKFLEQAGFTQVVLARELTSLQINEISAQTNVTLEAFIHGALCVSYSGQCYLSQAISGRSANRGECAQYCRLPYSLMDSEGTVISTDKHLLSMKDLNLSADLENLIDAGVSSLKIEGRLKDVSYVKNTVAHYRSKLDEIINRRPEYLRASSGHSTYTFKPDINKSFNRGYTDYFLNGRKTNIWSVDSPKSIGEPVGKVTEVTTRFFKLNSNFTLANGDGLCFFNTKKELEGFQVNNVDGDKIFPSRLPQIKRGTFIYRNHDHEFEKLLQRNSAERKIDISINLKEIPFGFSLEAIDEDDTQVVLNFEYKKETAKKDQTENIRNNLSKTGTTIFNVQSVNLELSQSYFIPSSVISDWRRQLTDRLIAMRVINYRQPIVKHKQTFHPFPVGKITYLGNVMNESSKQFYTQHKAQVVETAFERNPQESVPLMFTRHCIKFALGWCVRENKVKHKYKEPFYLLYNNTRLRLDFDCKLCEMRVYRDK